MLDIEKGIVKRTKCAIRQNVQPRKLCDFDRPENIYIATFGNEYGCGAFRQRFDKRFSKESFDVASEIGLGGIPDLPSRPSDLVLERFFSRR